MSVCVHTCTHTQIYISIFPSYPFLGSGRSDIPNTMSIPSTQFLVSKNHPPPIGTRAPWRNG